MESSVLVELKPNRSLLEPNFAGYKLSLDPIPMYIGSSSSKVDHVLRSEEQYSLQHVKLFGLHNHLFCDPWSLDDVYFIDDKWMVQKSVLSQETERLTGVRKVWEIPSNHERRPGHYNPSASFPADDLVLLSDGSGTLHLVNTPDRQNSKYSSSDNREWQVLISEEVCGAEVPFVLVHSMVIAAEVNESQEAISGRKVHCLLLHVEESKNVKGQRALPVKEGPNSSRSTAFVTVIEWVTLHEGKDGSWSVGRIRQLCGSAIPDYATLDLGGNGVIIGSEQPFIFITDTEKPLLQVDENDDGKKSDPADDSGITWQQDLEEVRVTIPLHLKDEVANITEVAVNVDDGQKVSIVYRDKILLKGVTSYLLDHDLTTWEIQDNMLKICFHKGEKGQMWKTLLSEGGPMGVEEVDPNLSEEIHNRLAHLTSEFQDPAVCSTPVFNSEELEECDEAPSTSASLCRLDGDLHSVSHKVSISSNQWLFNVQMEPKNVTAICLRHGLDGLLWQPLSSYPYHVPSAQGDSKEMPEEWNCSHVASFISFGYVQASKQRKKFIACSSDASFVAVCEASQYIYIYRQPSELAGNAQLRNRRTGEQIIRVARQHLISLPSSQEVLGIHASATTLYVLMEDKLLSYLINQ